MYSVERNVYVYNFSFGILYGRYALPRFRCRRLKYSSSSSCFLGGVGVRSNIDLTGLDRPGVMGRPGFSGVLGIGLMGEGHPSRVSLGNESSNVFPGVTGSSTGWSLVGEGVLGRVLKVTVSLTVSVLIAAVVGSGSGPNSRS